jgi:hypothetical protein
MAALGEAPKNETFEVDGHVVTRGCKFLPTLNLWEPLVWINPSWSPAEMVDLVARPEHYRDTSHDALGVATDLLASWIVDNPTRAT